MARVSGNLLDTSVVIATDGRRLELPDTAAISIITLGELRAGVRMARTPEIGAQCQGRLDAVRAAFRALIVDEPVADAYGETLAIARAARRSAKATDLLIIATAAAHERTLYTLDDEQAALARVAGVPVVAAGGASRSARRPHPSLAVLDKAGYGNLRVSRGG